jgi:hypothetical protein
MAHQDARRPQRHWAAALIVLLLVAPARAQDEEAAPPDLTLQDPAKTPGKVRPLTKKQICATKWGLDRRYVTAKMKLGVYHDYGLSGPKDDACVQDKHGRRCEVDHLIPRSLGGADDTKNLWPQPFGTQPWNASRKDRLEVRLSKEVCKGNLSLAKARKMMKTDYRKAYVHYFGAPP